MPNAIAPDLIVIARRIHVLGDHPPVQALLVRGGRIAALGTEAEVRAAALPGARTERIDGVVTPGLTDAHVHLTLWALARRRVDLNAARSLDEGLAAVAEASRTGEGWVRGLGWDRNRWGGLPTREPLDRVCPARPAFLQSHDLHGAWVNSEALRRCGITRDTPDPEGGEIVRGAGGEPTGVLLEKAVRLVESQLPEESPEDVRAALLEAQAEAHRLGLTGVHSVDVTGLEDFTGMEQGGVLRLRVLQSIPLPRLDHAIGAALRSGFGGPWIRIGGVKMFLDGALGSRTALMREPYEGGGPDDTGICTLEPDVFRENVRKAAEAGIASTVHAIGDAAVELAVGVLGGAPRVAAMPHRIEHVQLCPPDLWARAGASGLVASMQPVHLVTDIPTAERHWGHDRSRGAYAFAPLQAAGMTLAFGSDVPVETCDPRIGLFAAVRRVGWDGSPGEGWWMENAITAEQALRAYTEGPAHAAGLSNRQGRLLPGYDADLVAWDLDPLDCEPEALRDMRCLLTMVDGEIVRRGGIS
ncbi:MAG TPA: amidohydrolase [Longimicrobium sp.]|nr:amidohydrolase [Longimicrobium sp.]